MSNRSASDSQGIQGSPFLKLEESKDAVVRIIDQEPVYFWAYWIEVNVGGGNKQGRSLIVPRDNPIKHYMDSLGEDHPKFKKPRHRARTNVYDRTPDGANGEPSNKIKILEYGPELDKEFQTLNGRARKRSDFSKKLYVWEFDLLLITSFKIPGDHRTKNVKIMQHLDDDPLSEDVLRLPRYDLRAMSQVLPADAAQALLDDAEYLEVMKRLGREATYPMTTP